MTGSNRRVTVFIFLCLALIQLSLGDSGVNPVQSTEEIHFALPLPALRGPTVEVSNDPRLYSIGTRLPDGRIKHVAAGYLVEPGWILTAAHPVADMPAALIIAYGQGRYDEAAALMCVEVVFLPVETVSADGTNDVALLKLAKPHNTSEPAHPPAQVDYATLRGWDESSGKLRGREAQLGEAKQEGPFLSFDLPANLEVGAGNSGAPLFKPGNAGESSLEGILIAGERRARALYPHRLIVLRLEPFREAIRKVINGDETVMFKRR